MPTLFKALCLCLAAGAAGCHRVTVEVAPRDCRVESLRINDREAMRTGPASYDAYVWDGGSALIEARSADGELQGEYLWRVEEDETVVLRFAGAGGDATRADGDPAAARGAPGQRE